MRTWGAIHHLRLDRVMMPVDTVYLLAVDQNKVAGTYTFPPLFPRGPLAGIPLGPSPERLVGESGWLSRLATEMVRDQRWGEAVAHVGRLLQVHHESAGVARPLLPVAVLALADEMDCSPRDVHWEQLMAWLDDVQRRTSRKAAGRPF